MFLARRRQRRSTNGTGPRRAGRPVLEVLEGRCLPSINEFPIPSPNALPVIITTGPDGNLWFTERGASKIGQMAPDGTVLAEYPTPRSPNGLTVGPDGNLWFTEYYSDQIGMLDPNTGAVTEFQLPTQNFRFSIAAGADGNLWFTEYYDNNIGRITPDGQVTEFPIPTPNVKPDSITAGPDGNVWFTEQYGNAVGRVTPDGQITEFRVGGQQQTLGLSGITAGPDGNVWFCEAFVNRIGVITPDGSQITEYPLPENALPDQITTGPDGNLWFAENLDRIGTITPDGSQITTYPTASGSNPIGITAGPDGNLWFTEFGSNKIAQFIPDSGPAALAPFLAPSKALPATAALPVGVGALTGTSAFNANVAVTGQSPVVPGGAQDAAPGDGPLAIAARRAGADLIFQQLGQGPAADQLGALLTGLAPGQS